MGGGDANRTWRDIPDNGFILSTSFLTGLQCLKGQKAFQIERGSESAFDLIGIVTLPNLGIRGFQYSKAPKNRGPTVRQRMEGAISTLSVI